MNTPTLKGIITPLLTPLKSPSEPDGPALERLVEHVISGGVGGIFLLGSTGEGPALPGEVRKKITRWGARAVSERVPMLVNISSASFTESIRFAEQAARDGADYVVLTPPFYYELNQAEVLNYYASIARHSPLPLIIYNAPRYTRTGLEPAVVGELQKHPGIAGIKDSSGSMEYIRELLRTRTETSFPILTGPELLLAESLLLGCDGGVPGGSNLYPSLYVNLYRSVMEKNRKETERIQAILHMIDTKLYAVAGSPMGIVIGLKYLLARRGLCPEQMAMPVNKSLSAGQKQTLLKLDKEIRML